MKYRVKVSDFIGLLRKIQHQNFLRNENRKRKTLKIIQWGE